MSTRAGSTKRVLIHAGKGKQELDVTLDALLKVGLLVSHNARQIDDHLMSELVSRFGPSNWQRPDGVSGIQHLVMYLNPGENITNKELIT